MNIIYHVYSSAVFHNTGGSQVKENGALNAGLLDQVSRNYHILCNPGSRPCRNAQRGALSWLQKYIHLFGGDNKSVENVFRSYQLNFVNLPYGAGKSLSGASQPEQGLQCSMYVPVQLLGVS